MLQVALQILAVKDRNYKPKIRFGFHTQNSLLLPTARVSASAFRAPASRVLAAVHIQPVDLFSQPLWMGIQQDAVPNVSGSCDVRNERSQKMFQREHLLSRA